MNNEEFSNEFDVLYNSITSNQAPGLDEYEKSVFLTKAQDEIIKSYFNPRTNKTQEGFDGNERRQIDFSMIMRSKVYEPKTIIEKNNTGGSNGEEVGGNSELVQPLALEATETTVIVVENINKYIDSSTMDVVSRVVNSDGETEVTLTPFKDSFFDLRPETKSVVLEDDILMFTNEYVVVNRHNKDTRLIVVPINYMEYSRLMSKPYKRPLKSQAWRLLDNSDSIKKAEIVVGPGDNIEKYVIRYVKRPRAIIIDRLPEGTSLDGYFGSDATGKPTTDPNKAVQGITCELDPILHPEILQRAVELAKAAYTGDLQSQVALGQTSQTNLGVIQSSR